MDHSPFELVERTVSQPWADDMPTKVEYRSFSPCACKAGEMVVSLRPIAAPVQRLMAKTWPKWWDFLNEQSNILPNPEPVRTEEG